MRRYDWPDVCAFFVTAAFLWLALGHSCGPAVDHLPPPSTARSGL